MTTYIEEPSDHAFTAFLSSLTPAKVLRDREANFSRSERKRQRFLREKASTERTVRVRRMFTREEIETAQRVIAAQKAGK